LWQFPHFVGTIDGKDIAVQAPHDSGFLFFNYKNTFSIFSLGFGWCQFKCTIIDVDSKG
jgi:hypothetical protein